jgi:Transposase and inactivated derivatives
MNAVGIDVSKGRSTVAILRPFGEVIQKPEDVFHDPVSLEQLADKILALGEDTKVLMEATGRYHEPIASELYQCGIFVSVVNPLVIHNYSTDASVRKVKNDQKDALKIAKFCLDHWEKLREYTPMDTLRQQLKLLSRQYNLYMKSRIALENNLISLTDKVFPGVNELFKSPERFDGHCKWVDFVTTFWHCECISHVSEKAFTDRYQKWCKRMGYHFTPAKASDIYTESLGHIVTLPKTNNTKFLIQTAAKELTAMSEIMAGIRAEMLRLAKQLPEYDTVMSIYGVGETTGVQLMAEIGDVRNFSHRSSLISFAGIDPEVNDSGKKTSASNPSTKRGSPHLRKTLFQIVSAYLKLAPQDEPVYRFIDKKRAEGKPYLVYMTAGMNKFLRIYYARVKACMNESESAE